MATAAEHRLSPQRGIVLIGKVRYLGTGGSVKWARGVIRDTDVPDVRLLGRTLFVKRMVSLLKFPQA